MDNYRTSSLFHFTNKKNNLKNILKEGIKPNYAKETFLDKSVIGIPMISMCDIPISRTKTIQRYGSYAIGFTKEWGFRNGFNPIHYIQGKHFETVHNNFIELNTNLHNKISEHFNEKENSTFIPTLITQPENNDSYLFYRTYNLYLSSLSYSKPYYGKNKKGKIVINYDENEWRYISPVLPNKNWQKAIEEQYNPYSNPFLLTNYWLWGIEEYNKWRGDEKKTKPKSMFKSLNFLVSDISFIMLQLENQIPDMINFISKLNSLAGTLINEDEKKILMSKIISFERITKDF